VEKNFATISLRFCISFAREKIENFAKNTELKKCRQKLKIVAINCYSDKTHGFLQNFREIFAFRISRHFFRESFRSLETLFLTRQCFSIVNLTSVFKITPKKSQLFISNICKNHNTYLLIQILVQKPKFSID